MTPTTDPHPAPTLYLTVGLPGAGKTTRAREIAADQGIPRLTPDEWMAPLFGSGEGDGMRDIVEARLVSVARDVLACGLGVVLDFGCWSPDERWSLRAIAAGAGAGFELVFCDLDEAERRRRTAQRWIDAPETTFEMTEAEHDLWLTQFRRPTPDEFVGELPAPPAGFETWGDWAADRWPTLPVFPTPR